MGSEWKISCRGLPTTENDIIYRCQRTAGSSYLEYSFIALQGKKLQLYPIMEIKQSSTSSSHKVSKCPIRTVSTK